MPVSSTGHLILTAVILRIPQTEFVKSFEIFIQLGAIFSIVFLYKDTIFKKFTVWKKVLAAFIPTAVVGLTLYKIIKHYLLGNSFATIASLFIGGILFIILEKIYKKKKAEIISMETLSYPIHQKKQSYSLRDLPDCFGNSFLDCISPLKNIYQIFHR